MPKMSDPTYLLTDQYQDATKLNIRAQLHNRFNTNKYDWQYWVFDHLKLASESRILELGCGPGYLWLKNLDRILPGWHITLSDFSQGMLAQAQKNLQRSPSQFQFKKIDAQSIPFKARHFDAVIANHMLYHVPDKRKAYVEIRRVLKNKGRFYAATNGQAHMQELWEMFEKISPNSHKNEWLDRFTLENGANQLANHFSNVTLHHYESGLRVTEIEPLVAYIASAMRGAPTAEALAQFSAEVKDAIHQRGAIHISKSTGLFEAW